MQPWGIDYDPINERMYVTNFNDNIVSVIDTNTNTVIDAITNYSWIGNGPTDITYDPVHERMYVTNFTGGTVSVIDTNTNTVIGTDHNQLVGLNQYMQPMTP